MLEVNAREGQLYQVLEMSPKEGSFLTTVVAGWIDYYRRHKCPPPVLMHLRTDQEKAIKEWFSEFDNEKITRLFLVDAFISEQFRRSVNNDLEYRTTAYYSSGILSAGSVGQFLYPSVANYGGWNVAIRPDLVSTHLEVSSIKLIRIDRNLGFGMYNWSLVRSSEVSEGTIRWL